MNKILKSISLLLFVTFMAAIYLEAKNSEEIKPLTNKGEFGGTKNYKVTNMDNFGYSCSYIVRVTVTITSNTGGERIRVFENNPFHVNEVWEFSCSYAKNETIVSETLAIFGSGWFFSSGNVDLNQFHQWDGESCSSNTVFWWPTGGNNYLIYEDILTP